MYWTFFDGKGVSAAQKVRDISKKFSKRKNEIEYGIIIRINTLICQEGSYGLQNFMCCNGWMDVMRWVGSNV